MRGKGWAIGIRLCAALLPWAGQAAADTVSANDILRSLAPGGAYQTADPSVDLDIQFETGSARLSPEADQQLQALAEALASPGLRGQRLIIAGHTDATGPAEYNLDLSQRRAASVVEHLVTRLGIDPDLLVSEGHGEERLKHPFDPGAVTNRRVEIILMRDALGSPTQDGKFQSRDDLPADGRINF